MAVRGSKNLQRQLDRIAKDPAWAREGLRSLAFETKDQIARDTARQFDATPRGRRLIEGGWRVKYRFAGSRFIARIFPLDRTARLLAKHTAAARLGANEGQNLTVGGDIAVPVEVRRSTTGRVRASETPGALLRPRGKRNQARGFISKDGRSLMVRVRGAAPKLAFALVPNVKTRKRIDPHATAERVVQRDAGRAFARAWRKLMRRTT